MAYSIQVEREVIDILDRIDEYCIEHYDHYEIKPNHHKITLVNLGYNLY